ncbi:hypothetical protein FHS89_001844 [Rubricella aquisinus]|uniref:DUF2852 domain-containing protein n=1 Tax=Rubricella aquisinus TaxID=2028108 RepID=A0A840WZF2_9RHOB|nr:DUF2852 domain-containing protein [Rubricella aquisinus]MBB5515824.1 hypothetical protein [Rubricella aquisinus]
MQSPAHYLKSAESWLDSKGKGAWIATMILAFIFIWPIGLAILFYMIWSNRMSCNKSRSHRGWGRDRFAPTGNHAFDAYREETLKRLEEEQEAFQGFLDRLRQAKDKTEFDQFMDQRRSRPADNGPEPQAG